MLGSPLLVAPRSWEHNVSAPLTILLAPNDPIIGALMAELVRIAGHTPRFARVDETVRGAIHRLSPQALLLDCDHDDCDEDLLQTAKTMALPIIFFSGTRSQSELERFARRHGVHAFVLPNGPSLLRSTIERATL
jgi:DNA-binding NtrC family response regulator